MSTLGRKAIKKTITRLRKEAGKDIDKYLNARDKGKETRYIIEYANNTILSLISYIQALEDYSLELDEEWDKLLKSVEQVAEGKATKKKNSKGKTPII